MSRERDALHYANCWEDADLLVSRVGAMRGQRVLSICSGGENSLSLLSLQPGLLVVVDKSPVQLFLFELKKVAMKTLGREEFLGFLGYAESTDRWRTYALLRGELGPGARGYWDAQRGCLEKGVIHAGRVERTLRLLARFVLPLIHDTACSRELMARKNASEQRRFFRTVWDNRRWRAMVKVLFGKPAIYAISPEADFFKYHSGSGVAEFLLEKTAQHFSSVTVQENHILHYLLFGQFGRHLPHFARQENYETIRASLDAVVTHEGMLETAFPVFGRFDAFNLSNIFEYTTPGTFEVVAAALAAGANPGAHLAYWNIMVLRALSAARPDAFRNLLDTGLDRSVPDKGWHYSRFLLDERADPRLAT
jgi:S-adenosylmethionine-diacylglycerol 3-amino-3-carboxypropyl transferase